MRSGDYRFRLGFYKRTVVSDGAGNTRGEFPDEPEFTCAAAIVPKLGGEAVLAQRLQGTNLVNITVRYSRQTADVGDDWRAVDDRSGEIYNIRSIIDPTGRRAELEILAEKGVG